MNRRRHFVLNLVPLAGAVGLLPRLASAQSLPALTESEPMATALGFRLEASKVDVKKFPKYTKDQACGNCLHFTTAGADIARCDLFNKMVPKGGWCRGFSKRA